MATSERARHELYGKLEEVLGPVHTDTLMDHLPPGGWGDVATRHDLGRLQATLSGQLSQLDAKLGARIDKLEARIDKLDAKLDTRIAALDTRIDKLDAKLDSQVGALRLDLSAVEERIMSRMHRALAMQTGALLVVVVGALATALLALAGS
ncbi:MAG TPA: hypothetical protein VM324_06225 [Egibacteraceae bacterium]|nr:hypothetical protein [Egibacteraceae bacterium]